MNKENKVIIAIDLKSFYASVECIDRNLDPFKTPLVVADSDRGDGTIVLAASPFIKKKYHVKSRCRLYDVPKVDGLIIAMPKMKRYLEVSAMINMIYLEYVSNEDLFVYSIDESFLDCTNYLKICDDSPKSYAKKIIDKIKTKTGLTVTAGIGSNMFMAKACMDIEAKHNKECLAEWNYKDIPSKLWPITPLSKMWGIGNKLEKRLNDLGMYCIGDIACSDIEFLKKKFGVIGEEIYYHSLGYDDAILQERYTSKEHSISVGQVLLRDYKANEMSYLLTDIAWELSDRLHDEKKVANSFLAYLGYRNNGGIVLKIQFYSPTDSGEKIAREAINKFMAYKDEVNEFRLVSIVALDVIDTDNYQISLFENYENEYKVRNLEEVLKSIRRKYGSNKAMPCSALSFSSTYINRRNQIGGHHI